MDKLFGNKLDSTVKGKRVVDTVNIFINFESLYNCVRNHNVEKHIEACTKKEMNMVYRNCISNFINVAAHYRKYFTNHKIKSNIVFYYNEIGDEYVELNNSAIVDGYRSHHFESVTSLDRLTVNSIIQESIPFMKIITEYIEDVFMIGTERVESSLIPYILTMENQLPSNMNIVVTKDPYDYQYVNENFLVVSRYKNDAVVLTKKNIMRFMRYRNKCDITREINPLLLPFVLSCLGDRKRSIDGVSGFKFIRVYKSIIKLYDSGYIYDEDEDTMGIGNLTHVLNQSEFAFLKKEDLCERLMSNYRATDFEYQFNQVSDYQKQQMFDQMSNKTDPNTLMEINEKYFEDFPLMLLELNNYHRNNDMDKEIY